ncbi:hypothetical protein T07_13346, partial [Trichinella nelsoni]
LVFFIVAQWVVSVQWNYFYKLEYLSLNVVQVGLMALPSIGPEICVALLITGIHHTSLVVPVAISAFGEYFCRMNEIAAFFGNYPLLNIFVITSINTSSQSTTLLMPLSLATSGFRESFKGNS